MSSASRRPERAPATQLTPRDLDMLRWIARHGIVTARQVGARFFEREDAVGQRAAYRRLRKLEAAGLLRRDATFWKGPHVLRLTHHGARTADVGIGPARRIPEGLRHALEVVDLTERLLAEHPAAELTTEREIWVERGRNRGASGGRTPDAVLRLPSGETVAIELDLTPKRTVDIERIILAYSVGGYQRVWWYCLPGRVAARVAEIVLANRADDFIEVREWMPSM